MLGGVVGNLGRYLGGRFLPSCTYYSWCPRNHRVGRAQPVTSVAAISRQLIVLLTVVEFPWVYITRLIELDCLRLLWTTKGAASISLRLHGRRSSKRLYSSCWMQILQKWSIWWQLRFLSLQLPHRKGVVPKISVISSGREVAGRGEREHSSLIQHNMYSLIQSEVPANHRNIGTRYLYRVKPDQSLKARLVV